jgi:hypothetical protein
MDINTLNFTTIMLDNSEFGTARLHPFLTFGDMRSLALSNKSARATVISLVNKWPVEVQKFLKRWCIESPERIMAALYDYAARKELIVQFKAYHLSFDAGKHQLTGHPWSTTPNEMPQARVELSCFANDESTLLFRCIYISESNFFAWLFDIHTGVWTRLPSLPQSQSAYERGDDSVLRIGSKMYIIPSGNGSWPVKCFDMELGRWVGTHISSIPGVLYGTKVLVQNERSVIVVCGDSQRAYTLDIISGRWSRSANAPWRIDYITRNNDGDVFVLGYCGRWARLTANREWELNPNLSGLTALSMDKNAVFSDDSCLQFPRLPGIVAGRIIY